MALSKITSNAFSTTANTSIDNGTLFVDPVNNRVGVNTAVGQAALTVQSYGADGIHLLTDPANPVASGRLFLSASNQTGALYYQNTAGWVFNTGSSIQNTSGTPRLYISPEGRITKPYQPSFMALKSGSILESDITAGGMAVPSWATPLVNVGSHFNNTTGRFTAPISGVYFFVFNCMHSGNVVGDYQIRWLKNGGVYGNTNQTGQGGTWDEVTVACVMQLNTNEYAEPGIYSGGGTSSSAIAVYSGTYTHVSGYLIG